LFAKSVQTHEEGKHYEIYLLYIEKLSQEETDVSWWKTVTDCSLVPPKDATPPNFVEKTFTNSHKTSKFTKFFFLESFPLYLNIH